MKPIYKMKNWQLLRARGAEGKVILSAGEFVAIGKRAFWGKHNRYIESVTLPTGVSVIKAEAFAECKNLKFLELSNCTYITDLTPLAECKELEMLNISFTGVTDLAPIEELPLTHLTAVQNKLADGVEAAYAAAHPDCWIVTTGNEYGVGWRYDTDNQTKLPWYEKMSNAFKYPNPYNNVGWYLD